MRVVFINYGLFNSNSGGHVSHFANSLSALGVETVVIGSNDPRTVNDFGPPSFTTIQANIYDDEISPQILDLTSGSDVLLHAWTPRKGVQRFVQSISNRTGCPYIVHLEDHEIMLFESAFRKNLSDIYKLQDDELQNLTPPSLTNPRTISTFLKGSVGVTAIVDRLSELCPSGVPIHLLEPGVDTKVFNCDLSPQQIISRRKNLYIDSGSIVIVYNGNMHSANYKDIFSLYTAVLILRRRGHDVRLIRTGEDYFNDIDVSYQALNGDWVVNLGKLDRSEMIDVLKLADLYVQPGEPGNFNAFRLPSKIPEFLALGKPVILPASNIGLRLADLREAVLLSEGNGEEIANRVEWLLSSPLKAAEIGKAGRAFALQNLSWDKNAEKLIHFYKSVIH